MDFVWELDVETCVNGLIGTVNWILDYGGHKFFFFFFGLRYLVDGPRVNVLWV